MRSILLLALSLSTILAVAKVDPSIEWKVLNTEHFEVIFDSRQRELAELYAVEAERAYLNLQPVYQEMTEKTVIVVLDNTDQSNGYANFLPFPHIVIFPVLPSALDSIDHYDNWARELITHEYAHILSFQPSHSFYTPLRYLFGTVVRPNAVLPRWFLEGVAVQMESRYTGYGRLRSPGMNGTLRAMILDQTLRKETIATINESSIPTYPYGGRPYLFGSLLWAEMLSQTKNQNLVKELHQRHSRRLPFFLNAPIEEETGHTYSELLDSLFTKIEDSAKNQMSKIQQRGDDGATPLNHSGTTHLSPAYSPSGERVVYTAYVPYSGNEVRVMTEKGVETLFVTSGTQKLSWIDNNRFVYDKVDTFDRYYKFSDLYIYDFESKKSECLTEGLRAKEPSASPNGQRVAFVKIDGAHTELQVMDLADKKVISVFRPLIQSRISRPEFIDDSNIIFAGKGSSGIERLYRIAARENSKPQRILPSFQSVSHPRRTRKGLLFTSAQSGIANLYLANPQLTSARALTNSLTRIIHGDLHPKTNELIVSEMTGRGPQLELIKKPRYQNPPKLMPVIAMNLDPIAPVQNINKDDVKMEEENFWGIEYLLPRYWIPFIYPVDGGILFQGTVEASDPLQINSYLLNGAYDTVTQKGSYGFSYTNRSTSVDLTLAFAEFQDYLPGSATTVTNRYGAVTGSFYLPALSDHWHGLLGYAYDEAVNPFVTPPLQLKGAGPIAGMTFSNIGDPSKRSSSGTLIDITHTEFLKQSDFYEFGRSYFSLANSNQWFLPLQHSFLIQLKGSHAPLMNFSDIVTLGDKTIGGNYLASLIHSNFLMRGYPSGAFVGRTLLNSNLEYRFPMSDLYRGPGTFPLFLQNLTAAVFFDAVSVDGGYFNTEAENYISSESGEFYTSTGIEFHLNTTAAYHLPVSMTLGLYYGFNERAGGGFIPFIGLGYTGHQGID